MLLYTSLTDADSQPLSAVTLSRPPLALQSMPHLVMQDLRSTQTWCTHNFVSIEMDPRRRGWQGGQALWEQCCGVNGRV